MPRFITLNSSNAKYIADFVASVIQQASAKDKILGDLYKMPEFSSAMHNNIKTFFQQNSSKNVKIDLDKLSQIKISSSDNSEDTNEALYEENEDEEKTVNALLSNNNIRTANFAVIARIIAAVAPRLMGIITTFLGPAFSAVMPFLTQLFNMLRDGLSKMAAVFDKFIKQFADPDFYKELVLSYNAYDAINESKRKQMYSASAFTHMLENQKTRGYGGQLHSQGAYESLGPEFKKQMADQIKKNPDLVKSRFKDDPNLGPEIKKNMGRLIKSNNNKFIKVSQEDMSERSQQKLEELKGLIPNWDMKKILQEVHAIYQSPDVAENDKQQLVNSTITKYTRAIQPLYAFLKENDFPIPDAAK